MIQGEKDMSGTHIRRYLDTHIFSRLDSEEGHHPVLKELEIAREGAKQETKHFYNILLR